jgi:tetratricopeptide (TPR) repeat protein
MAKRQTVQTTLVEQAAPIFVDREAHIVLFNKLVAELVPGGIELLVINGIGGQGKTRLCHRLLGESRAKHEDGVITAHLDLSRRHLEPESPLLWIRNEFASRSNIGFELFDFGFGLYWSVTHPEQALPTFKGRGWLKLGADVAVDTAAKSGGDVIAALPEALGQGVHEALQKVSPSAALRPLLRYGFNQVGLKILEARFAKDIERLQGLMKAPAPAASLFRELPGLLAKDMARAPARNRFVILIDEYERAFDDRGAEVTLRANPFDEAIRELAIRAERTLIVVFSRERLPWGKWPPAGEDPEAWSRWVDSAHRPLAGLDADDAKLWLQKIPVTETDVAGAMIDGARVNADGGVATIYPVMLDYQVEHYLGLKRRGIVPTPDEFRTNETTLDALHSRLFTRVIGDYKEGTRDLIRRLAVPRYFDRRTYDALRTLAPAGATVDAFNVVTRLSFLQDSGDGTFVMQNAVREGVLRSLGADDIRATRQLLWDTARERLAGLKELRKADAADIVEALHHGLAVRPRETIAWWGDLRRRLFSPKTASMLLQAHIELSLGLEAWQPRLRAEIAAALDELGEAFMAAGQLRAAIESMSRALALHRRLKPPGSAALLPLLIGLANLHRVESEFLHAELLLDEALDVANAQSRGGSTVEQLEILRTAALSLEGQGLVQQAEPLRLELLRLARLYRSPGSRDVAESIGNLIVNLMLQSRFDEAEALIPEFIEHLSDDDTRPLWALVSAVPVVQRWIDSLRGDVGSRLARSMLERFGSPAAEDDDNDDQRCWRRLLLSRLALSGGDVDAAIRWAGKAVPFARGSPSLHVDALLNHASLLLRAGRAANAAEVLRDADAARRGLHPEHYLHARFEALQVDAQRAARDPARPGVERREPEDPEETARIHAFAGALQRGLQGERTPPDAATRAASPTSAGDGTGDAKPVASGGTPQEAGGPSATRPANRREGLRQALQPDVDRLPEPLRQSVIDLLDGRETDLRALLAQMDGHSQVSAELRLLILVRAAAAEEEHDGDLEHARAVRERLVEELFASLGARHPATRKALADLALVCERLHQWTAAHTWRRKALRDMQLLRPGDAAFFAEHAPQLANDLVYLGNPSEALAVLDCVGQLPEGLLPRSSHLWWDVHRASARALRDAGELDRARQVAERLVDSLNEDEQSSPAWKALAHCIAAGIAVRQREHEAARRHADEARILAQGLDDDLAWVRSAAEVEALRLGVCADGQRLDRQRAEAIVEGYARYADWPFYVSVMGDLAEIALHARDTELAQRWLKEGVAAGARVWGENSAPHLKMLEILADVQEQPDDPALARKRRWTARVAAAARSLRPIDLQEWPWPSSARDRWRLLEREETAHRISRVIEAQARDGDVVLPERYKVLAARSRELLFYPGAELVEFLVLDGKDNPGSFAAVQDAQHVLVLNGESRRIHNLNYAYRLTLEDDEQREIEYLRFFSSWLMGAEGPFTIVESAAETVALQDDYLTRLTSKAFRPVRRVDSAAPTARRQFDAVVVYAGIPFDARLRLETRGGDVKMLKDQPLAERALFARWLRDGGARFLIRT